MASAGGLACGHLMVQGHIARTIPLLGSRKSLFRGRPAPEYVLPLGGGFDHGRLSNGGAGGPGSLDFNPRQFCGSGAGLWGSNKGEPRQRLGDATGPVDIQHLLGSYDDYPAYDRSGRNMK